jgi:hypothetical protein
MDSNEYCSNCNSCRVVEPDIFDYAESAKITREEAAEMIEEAARIIANVENTSQKRCNLQVLSAFIEIGRDWHIESAEENSAPEGKNASWEITPDDIPF